jgi:predicted dehydrogenase
VPWCVKALEAGKHVLCEKPLALTSADVSTLIEVRQRTGRIIEEAFSYRNHPQWEAVRGVLADGSLGEVRAV